MKYLIYIMLFVYGMAKAQVDVVPDSIIDNPVITTTQKLHGKMANAAIVNPKSSFELPKTIHTRIADTIAIKNSNVYGIYSLTQTDKDSLYTAAFNGQIVQAAIKAKFNGRSKLFERGYEIELLSLLKSDSISNDSKKQLLTRRILADIEYNRVNSITAGRKMPCYQNGIDKSTAIAMYKCLEITDFTGCIYVIDGLMYTVNTTEGIQSMFSKLQKTDIATIEIVRGDELKNTTFCSYPPNVIIITAAKH